MTWEGKIEKNEDREKKNHMKRLVFFLQNKFDGRNANIRKFFEENRKERCLDEDTSVDCLGLSKTRT